MISDHLLQGYSVGNFCEMEEFVLPLLNPTLCEIMFMAIMKMYARTFATCNVMMLRLESILDVKCFGVDLLERCEVRFVQVSFR